MTRDERRAADQAEYEASLKRAAEAQKEQRVDQPLRRPVAASNNAGDLGLIFGPLGLAIGAAMDIKEAKKKAAQ
jgi:hypothetical protein